MKRVLKFIRSVIPADPFQLLFLAGVVCLIAAHGLRWQPAELPSPGPFASSFDLWLQYGAVIFIYFIIFSAMAGYFVCFWPGKNPIRRTISFVCVPALLGLGLMFARVIYLGATTTSVLESTTSNRFRWIEANLWKLPEGFQFTVLGLVLIGTFISRMAFGIASLPIAMPNPQATQENSAAWRLQFLIFVLVGPFFLVGVLLSFVSIGIPFAVSARPPAYIQNIWFSRLAPVLEVVAACTLVLYLMGRENRQAVRDSIRLPDRMSVLLSLIFPIGIAVLISAGHFVVDREAWVAHGIGKVPPPEFRSYFDIPDPYFLLLFFSAFFEEIIFRGVLQRRFIARYGMYRGIFFIGIVWAAFHFFSDFSFSGATVLVVLGHLGMRLFMCVTLSFALGWLTLRSGSVLPAAVAHTLYNVVVFSGFGPPFLGKSIVQVALWAGGAYALFHFWPVITQGLPEPSPELSNMGDAD